MQDGRSSGGNTSGPGRAAPGMKRIGFLSFGHWQPVPGSQVRTGRDALVQTVELAVAAEELGVDGAYVRVHHFARQLASPFPLLAAMAARTERIELGTGVIDMRYENPLYMAEEAAAADLLSGGRLQLGVSRGSPETALRGSEAFGYVAAGGRQRRRPAPGTRPLFLAADRGQPAWHADPADDRGTPAGWRSSRSRRAWPTGSGGGRAPGRRREWTAEQGMNLMSSTLLVEDTGVPFDELQAEQIARFRTAWADAGWDRTPRVSVSRSVLPMVSDRGPSVLRLRARRRARTRWASSRACGPGSARATSASPTCSRSNCQDAAVQDADTLLITVPNMLGVDYNATLLESILNHVAPAAGWR